MASRVREEKVPKLKISFHELQRKCSELLLDGFESKPAEGDLGDVISSSSCTENDGRANVSNDAGQNLVGSHKKGASGGLFQIKPTLPHSTPQAQWSKGSRSNARRRRGSEQPERRQKDRGFHKEDEAGRFSEPVETRLSRQMYDGTSAPQFVPSSSQTRKNVIVPEDTQLKRASGGLERTAKSSHRKRGSEHTRLRRHTDEGRTADQMVPPLLEERRVGGASSDGRKDYSDGRRSSSSGFAEKDSPVLADWQRYTDGRIQKSLTKLTGHPSKLTQILHAW